MGFNKKFFTTGGIVAASPSAAPFDPLQNFETVTYTGTGATQKITGYIRKGAGFNGSSSYIDLNHKTAYSAFTISAWVNVTSTASAQSIVSRWYDGSNRSVGFYMAGGGQLTLLTSTNGSDTVITTGGTLTANTWHFVCVTFQSSGNITITLDGSTTTTAQNTTIYNNNQNWLIGMEDSRGGQKWNGKIDQVRMFNKAVSASEVTTLYGETYASATKSTTDIFGDSSGVALYELNESANDTGTNPYGTGAIDSGQSAVFNGSSSYIDLGNSAFQYTTFSISAWVYPTSAQNNTILENYESGGSPTNSGWFFRVQSDNTILFGGYGSQAYGLYTTSTVPLNTWTNVTVTFSPSASAIYFNSVAQPTASSGWNASFGTIQYSTGGNGNGNPTSIGRTSYTGGGSSYFYGRIDEIRVYDDTLTAAEILDITENDTSNIPTGNLQAHYKLDGNDNDSTGNTNGVTENSITYTDPATFPFIQYNGTATNINFLGMAFSPSLVWIQNRSSTGGYFNAVMDSIRGATAILSTNSSGAETTSYTQELTSFDSNGFTLGTGGGNYVNRSADDYVAWCFKSADTTTSISASGSQLASEQRANTAAGFSIVKYTGSGNSGDTVLHGLNSKPQLSIIKNLDNTGGVNWDVSFDGITGGTSLNLDTTTQVFSPTQGYHVADTTSLTLNSGGSGVIRVNTLNEDYIAYCFHSVTGYQKVGTYTGNSNTTGPLVDVGFEPRFLLVKGVTSGYSSHWAIIDSTRDTGAVKNKRLLANVTNDEVADANWNVSFNSDGFQPKSTFSGFNDSNGTYLYLAIA